MIATSTVVMFILMYPEHLPVVARAIQRDAGVHGVGRGCRDGGGDAQPCSACTRAAGRNNIGIYPGRSWVRHGAGLVRTQVTVEDQSYMRAMIRTTRSRSSPARTRKSRTCGTELADEIISAQRTEIKEMEWLIDDIMANGVADTPEKAQASGSDLVVRA